MELDVMLCDHAQVADGKLFISGGNIESMHVPPGTPPPYVANFSVAGLIRVPWSATNSQHTLSFQFETEDGQPPPLPPGAGPEGGGIGGEMGFNVGRPPQLANGQEQAVPFAFNFQGLPLMTGGRYVLKLALDGTPARSLMFTVAVAPPFGFRGTALP